MQQHIWDLVQISTQPVFAYFENDDEYDPLYHRKFNFNFFSFQLILSALSRMLIYTGVFEFICSQSPHSMKGLIIGVFYAIRGLYQVLAALLVLPYSHRGTLNLSISAVNSTFTS